jgi:hypothetical protein
MSVIADRSLGLAGSIIHAKYRVLALASVSRDVVVYMAEELRFGRAITLKVLRDEIAGDAEFVAAARDQTNRLAMSAHVQRGFPRVYECGALDTGGLFIALEPTKGATLREVLDARGTLDPATALRIASQVGEALEILHHNRIVHGQLSLDSVLVVKDSDGRELVTLVGVELTAAYRTAGGRRRRDAAPRAYLAPEQLERDETTEATDQFALGMLLRELLTGDRSRTTIGADPGTPPVPPEIDRIITTALDARPEHRFPDISVMVNDMWAAQTALAEPAPRPRSVAVRANTHRRPRPRAPHAPVRIAAAVGIAGILAVVVWFALSGGLVSTVRSVLTAVAVVTGAPAPVTAAPAAAPAAVTAPRAVTPAPAVVPAAPAVVTAAPAVVTAAPAAVMAPVAPDARRRNDLARMPSSPSRPRHDIARPTRSESVPDPAAAPRPAPVVETAPRRPVESPSAAEQRAENDARATHGGDGGAIIDWVLKRQR